MPQGQPRRRDFGLRFGRSLPYLLALSVALFLFRTAGQIEFMVPPGRIGPDFWPKLLVVLLMVACLYGIARNWIFGDALEVVGGVDSDTHDLQVEESQAGDGKRYPALVGGGIALASGYAWLVDKLGFLLCTFLFLAAFAYLGRYRRHGVIFVSSLVGAVVLMFLFMRVVYISLPIGIAPFSHLSLAAMKLMGIN